MFKNKVAKGAALMDKELPGWEQKIDLDRLDLGDFRCCIIGQAHPRQFYHEALHELFQTKNAIQLSQDHGFSVDVHDLPLKEKDKRYALLTEEWKAYIQERRNQHVSGAN